MVKRGMVRDFKVTPYVGVWIETTRYASFGVKLSVTPYVGVWIETDIRYTVVPGCQSLLMWECGLKQLGSVPRQAEQ